jgi:DNA-directed RNA polymerase specialized sigma24 family protein
VDEELTNPRSVEAALARPAVARLLRYYHRATAWADPDDVESAGYEAVRRAVKGHRDGGQKFTSTVRFFLKKRLASLAKAYARAPVPAGLLLDRPAEPPPPPAPAHAAAVGRVAGWVRGCLPAAQRAAVTKVFLEGKTRREAAAELGVGKNVFARLLRQGLAKLREVAELHTEETETHA